MQAGFNPAAKIAVVSTWQANDPLVHYHVEDLRYPLSKDDVNYQYYKPTAVVTNTAPGTLGHLNYRYSPWGGNTDKDEASYNNNIYNVWTRDPGAFSSDDWQFPNNKFASVGLLGRVHRGTPWQTIYFKAAVTNANTWLIERPTYLSHPSNDWKLPDMFTTALDERTSSGLMSINQTNMEAWSAPFGGMLVLSNNLKRPIVGDTRDYDELFIQPWGNLPYTNSGFAQIWNAIYNYQTDTNRGRPLASIGEFLQSVPELTTKSPFLNLIDADQLRYGLDDFAYEQIPQQILSLLRVGQARFVIYAYGQALKPQKIDPATGVVENYQVTAEYATRTVIRLEGDARTRVRAVVESFNILPPD